MSGTTVWTVERLQKEFENLGYNMLDCKIAASTALADPGKAYKALKMRCVCHWIWKNLLGRTGDNGHQAFLTLSRKFSQLANGKLTGAQKQEVESMVEKIKGTDR
eukprot:jgi/Tetstr1/429410/TSEL_019320.t1